MKYSIIKKAIKIIMVAFLSMLSIFITGCWSNRDLSEINIVSAIGIDQTEDNKFIVTVQIVEPAIIQSTSSGGGDGGSSQSKPVFVESYESDTVFEALRGVLSTVDKKLFISTSQVLILGERLCQNGIDEVLDFLLRDNEVEYEMDILVTKDTTPKEILEIENNMDSIPAIYIKGTLKNGTWNGLVKKTMLIDLAKDISSSGREVTIGKITKARENQVKTEGTAVFKDEKLIGWLDARETRGYLFTIGEIGATIINIPIDEDIIAIEVVRSKSKINVELDKGKPSLLTVDVKVDTNLAEYIGKEEINSPDFLYKLQEMLNKEVKKEIKMALDKAQKDYSSDIFGFGIHLYKFHPRCWNEVKENWNDIFSKLEVEINVDSTIKRTGVIKNPITKD